MNYTPDQVEELRNNERITHEQAVKLAEDLLEFHRSYWDGVDEPLITGTIDGPLPGCFVRVTVDEAAESARKE